VYTSMPAAGGLPAWSHRGAAPRSECAPTVPACHRGDWEIGRARTAERTPDPWPAMAGITHFFDGSKANFWQSGRPV